MSWLILFPLAALAGFFVLTLVVFPKMNRKEEMKDNRDVTDKIYDK